MAILVTKLETSSDILLPKVKDRLCLLKIDRTIQTDLGIQLNVVLFSFLKKKTTRPRSPKVPPRSITTYLLSPTLEIGGFCSSSSHDDEDEDAHSCRARQGPRLGDYLVIDTCLNKVGFTTKSGLRWSFRGGEDKSPGALAQPVHCWKTPKVISRKEKEEKRKSQARR